MKFTNEELASKIGLKGEIISVQRTNEYDVNGNPKKDLVGQVYVPALGGHVGPPLQKSSFDLNMSGRAYCRFEPDRDLLPLRDQLRSNLKPKIQHPLFRRNEGDFHIAKTGLEFFNGVTDRPTDLIHRGGHGMNELGHVRHSIFRLNRDMALPCVEHSS